ncbi:hypothetical protein E2562_034054 [Oryza meyeriana var. granulata]|uniref:Uncharacterized protein n=1 Tax=Oryza meyeriana var. granulata TaxID=110450 RepID=A0A6G1CAY8_9ORYZ|nr:hypothetical protein E2562_034054 [Oryza meyeriana var. granulata]
MATASAGEEAGASGLGDPSLPAGRSGWPEGAQKPPPTLSLSCVFAASPITLFVARSGSGQQDPATPAPPPANLAPGGYRRQF